MTAFSIKIRYQHSWMYGHSLRVSKIALFLHSKNYTNAPALTGGVATAGEPAIICDGDGVPIALERTILVALAVSVDKQLECRV